MNHMATNAASHLRACPGVPLSDQIPCSDEVVQLFKKPSSSSHTVHTQLLNKSEQKKRQTRHGKRVNERIHESTDAPSWRVLSLVPWCIIVLLTRARARVCSPSFLSFFSVCPFLSFPFQVGCYSSLRPS